jgi:DNA-directed RNA polymerase
LTHREKTVTNVALFTLNVYRYVEEFIAKPHVHDRFTRISMKSLKEAAGVRGVARLARTALNDYDWGHNARNKVGAALLNLMLDTARIKVPAPKSEAALERERERDLDPYGEWEDEEPPELVEMAAFHHGYQWHKGHKYGTVAWHEAFYQFMDDEHLIRATLQPVRYMPMVTPPRPWTRYNAGGYLRSESFIMRGHYTLHGPSKKQIIALNAEQSGAEAQSRPPKFQPVLDALNVLGRTAWVINGPVLRVMEEVWEGGGGRANVPPRKNKEDPEWPAAPFGLRFGVGRNQLLATALPSRHEVSNYIHALNRVKSNNRELHSQRCDFLIKLQVARQMQDEERIYFPHNIDFRGRAYTMHVHLNHLGSDVCRGALLFADERPLGDKGLDWLYIQAANLYGGGIDKLPMDERRNWIKDRVALLEASAADPLGLEGTFWLEAEDPWQCLAVCMEITNARASGDPAAYMCRLPVHQDGSCNGLQHYAALGRDETGGEQVNLMPRDQPGDVYTAVANVLKKIVAKDKEFAEDPTHMEYARLLEPFIDRKLVKQTVMTSVYGVTHIGARQQIQNRLKERGAIENENMRYLLANYAASKTLDALTDLFTNARDVMGWLAECARVVCSRGKAVEWTTPMGLPVVQPYRVRGRRVVRTIVQSFVLQYDTDDNDVAKAKQRSAFPPNFIHSVDSAHMMMTAKACHNAGLTFAGVHDSFWTHAGDVPEMSKHIRENFIELHKEPLLERLYEELKEKYPEIANELPSPPKPGKMDIEQVRDSLYFFS